VSDPRLKIFVQSGMDILINLHAEIIISKVRTTIIMDLCTEYVNGRRVKVAS